MPCDDDPHKIDVQTNSRSHLLNPSDKKLNQMDRLSDMAHFPAIVNLGASINVMATLSVTWLLVDRFTYAGTTSLYIPLTWVAIVLALNLLPVVLLRRTITPATHYPTLGTMDFIRDQHKFSDWVYLAASANMAFWVLSGWAIFSLNHSIEVLSAALAVAFLATFSPVLTRTRPDADTDTEAQPHL